MAPSHGNYPWYSLVSGDEIQQGDIFETCPMFSPRITDLANPARSSHFDWSEQHVIVLTQSCDLAKRPGQKDKLEHALLCSLFARSGLTSGHLSTNKGLEDARQGNLPSVHMLAECSLPDLTREVGIADFHRLWSLPLTFLRERCSECGPRLRLMPPYREQLSQSFARFFMRVGLPLDIPPFR